MPTKAKKLYADTARSKYPIGTLRQALAAKKIFGRPQNSSKYDAQSRTATQLRIDMAIKRLQLAKAEEQGIPNTAALVEKLAVSNTCVTTQCRLEKIAISMGYIRRAASSDTKRHAESLLREDWVTERMSQLLNRLKRQNTKKPVGKK